MRQAACSHAVVGMAVVSSVISGLPREAQAYIDGGSKACGCVGAGWNAPEGAVVSSRSGRGPIRGVITAIGEYYTHSMISHGPGSDQWVSHTTMRTPGVHVSVFGDDQVATDELRYGYPGPAQVNLGGAYKNLYADGLEAIQFTPGGESGARVAEYLWGGLPHCNEVVSGLCYFAAYSLQQKSYGYSTEYIYIIGRKHEGVVYRHSYGVYQYMDDALVPEGDDTSDPGWAMQCSSFVAWSLANATGQVMTSKSYPPAIVAPAAYQLHSSVTNECKSGAGWFGGLFVDCRDVADQVVNCFTSFYSCNDDRAGTWKNATANRTAISISPDRILGLGGHGDSNSPWAASPQFDLQWNSGGQVCGCWF